MKNAKEFLEMMATLMKCVNHDIKECDICLFRTIGSEVAIELLQSELVPDDAHCLWASEVSKRMHNHYSQLVLNN